MNKSVLITGASSGIGKEIAIKLAAEGYQVFAGVRKKSDKFKLEKANKNIIGVYLDVTSNSSIDKAFWFVLKKTNSLYALINNAGVAIGGPMEFMPIRKIKEQFEINTFGAIAVAQKFLPILTDGTIINTSSMASTGVFPFIAPYCASKRALEIFFNALSIELNSKNIKIVSIQPGTVKTPIWEKSLKTHEAFLKELPEGCLDKYKKELNLLERNALNSSDKGIEPRVVAELVLKIMKTKNPKPLYTVGFDAFLVVLFSKLPQGIVNFFVKHVLSKRMVC